MLYIDGGGAEPAEVVNLNYATGWFSGALLEGDFDDPDFPTALLTGASFEIIEDVARLIPTTQYGVALYGTEYQHFYSVEVELERPSGGGGIAFRARDGSNFYYFEFDETSGTFKLGKCVSSVLTSYR